MENEISKENLNKGWDLFINNENFKPSLLATGLKIASIRLSGDTSGDEYFEWYSSVAKDLIEDSPVSITDDEKLHFIALHNSILSL